MGVMFLTCTLHLAWLLEEGYEVICFSEFSLFYLFVLWPFRWSKFALIGGILTV